MLKSIVLLSVLAPGAALAQVAPQPDPAVTPDSTAIIVTADRSPIAADRVVSSLSVLDKPAIDRAGDIAIADLLTRTPGVSLSRNGGYGTATSLRIRGAEGDQTVVVLDGVKLNDPAAPDGSYNFGNLLVNDAARIEVLRGPQSTLWGSQAIGGVVNIVTALPTKPLSGSFDIEGGSRATVNARAALGGKSGPVTWRLAGESFTTDGISALAPSAGGAERDGYHNRSAQGRVEVALAEGVSADLRGYFSRGRTEIDGFGVDSFDYELNREWLGYAGLNVDLLGGRLRNRIGYSYTDTDRDDHDPSLSGDNRTFTSSGTNERIEYQGTLALAEGWTAVFGAERAHARFSSISPQYQIAADGGSATETDEYAQVNGTLLSGLTVSGGVRHDHYSSYGSHALFSGGAVWALPSGTVIRASYGEGFKAPSLYQLYSEYGNARLDPVRSHGWEAGAEQHLLGDAVVASATYFERRTRDQVIFNSCEYPLSSDPLCVTPATGAPRFGYYLNLARTAAHGVEVAATVRPAAGLEIAGNYSRSVAEDRSSPATDGNWLPRRPRDQANGSIDYRWGFGLNTGAAVRWAGHSFDDAANATRLSGYTLVDLRAELPIAERFTVFVRAENLFDEYYQTAFSYNTLGRSVYGGIRARL